LQLPTSTEIDLEFFKRFVTQTVATGPLARAARTASAPPAVTPVQPAPAAAVEAAATAAVAVTEQLPSSLQVSFVTQGAGRADLRVLSPSAGYVYCYAQDPATRAVRRVFPNRWAKDPRIEAGGTLSVPGAARFKLDAQQRYACIHAPREVYNDLPAPLRWGDFDEVKLQGFEQIRQAFAQSSGQAVSLALAQSQSQTVKP